MTKVELIRVGRKMREKKRKIRSNKRKTRANKLKRVKARLTSTSINLKIHHYCLIILVNISLRNWLWINCL